MPGKSKKTVPCPKCGELFRSMGLQWHMVIHTVEYDAAVAEARLAAARGETVKIPLTNGVFALVDPEDAERVLRHKWGFYKNKRGVPYPSRTLTDGKGFITLARFILNLEMGTGQSTMVDHINRNPLDNRRHNLRVVSPSKNAQNRTPRTSTGYKGVTLRPGPRGPKWSAVIMHEYKSYWLGTFNSPEDAARAYDAKAIELFGEHAGVNQPTALRDLFQREGVEVDSTST